MKLNKVAAGLMAAAVSASAMSAAASASIKVVDGNAPSFTSASGMWMVMLYKGDGAEVEIDYGLDLTKIAQAKVQFTTDDTDFFEGMFGGAFVMSCGPASSTPADHNWVQKNWWGVADDDAEIWTQDTESPLQTNKISDYTYELDMVVDDSNCFYDNATYCQVALSEWGQDLSQLVVLGMQFYDADGNSMIEFDANGKANIPNVAGQAPAETEAAPAETDAAPATSAAPAETQAPAAGDVAAATNSSKGSPDTGIADVAAVAGLAIVAGGAVLVAKKRK